jgi:hypothetical protein
VIAKTPEYLRQCLKRGADTTLMVWADLDHDKDNGDQLKVLFWEEAEKAGITKEDFDGVVFVFAKDRIENWIEFLRTGRTDENAEGPRVPQGKLVAVECRIVTVFSAELLP